MKKTIRWREVLHALHPAGSRRAVLVNCLCHGPQPVTPLPSLSASAGRLTVVAALVAFSAAYCFGIAQYGWWWGLGFGWLPASALAWLTAQVLAAGLAQSSRRVRSLNYACRKSRLRARHLATQIQRIDRRNTDGSINNP